MRTKDVVYCFKCGTLAVEAKRDASGDGFLVSHHGAEAFVSDEQLDEADRQRGLVGVFRPPWRGWEGFSREKWPLAESGFRM